MRFSGTIPKRCQRLWCPVYKSRVWHFLKTIKAEMGVSSKYREENGHSLLIASVLEVGSKVISLK